MWMLGWARSLAKQAVEQKQNVRDAETQCDLINNAEINRLKASCERVKIAAKYHESTNVQLSEDVTALRLEKKEMYERQNEIYLDMAKLRKDLENEISARNSIVSAKVREWQANNTKRMREELLDKPDGRKHAKHGQ